MIQLTIWKASLNTILQLKYVFRFWFLVLFLLVQWIDYAFRATISVLNNCQLRGVRHFNLVLRCMQEWAWKFSVQENKLVISIVQVMYSLNSYRRRFSCGGSQHSQADLSPAPVIHMIHNHYSSACFSLILKSHIQKIPVVKC